MYTWTIDEDLILENLKGVTGSSHPSRDEELKSKCKPHSFSLYDDDCYCVGRIWLSPKAEGSEQEFAPLDDIGESMGCTSIKIDGITI